MQPFETSLALLVSFAKGCVILREEETAWLVKEQNALEPPDSWWFSLA